ncbi:hypothetical protein [Chengkuizengella axinellae]|uniref:VCBS repeat-containing protein n=1 Tax=Chengkuizengella axinellae TaxID=3064388 RepID=A0ABT9J6J0_9BACL|nr:hypothetical protein [Chengkuizengella sp. 2205SS18-9]MDP5277241.1 hypothetical protein [Chengkuizengella sp. 2205SS18-9]
MKKFFIGLFIMILVFHTGKVYADERAVVGYIISDVWYHNIFLIADKKDSMAYHNFTVQIGDGGGHEQLYHFPSWYNSKFSPRLYYEDINGDELKDIIVVLISGAGTGISTKEIHVLNQVRDPYRRYEEVAVESINDAVKRLVKMKREGNEITISIDEKKYIVEYSQYGYYPPIDTPGVGSIEDYQPKDGILYGSTIVTIPGAQIGNLKVKYSWDGRIYKAESVTFIEK